MNTQEMSDRVCHYLKKKSADGIAVQTGVSFQSDDVVLQRLFDIAETKAAGNIVPFNPLLKVLVEGGGFHAAYLETQPMGGEWP